MYKCDTCEDDGYIEIMDADHYGAVIGVAPCPFGCAPTSAMMTDLMDATINEGEDA